MRYQTAVIKLIILNLYQLTMCNIKSQITKKFFKKFSEKLENVLIKNSNNFY